MSRKTRARRKARKARAPSQRLNPVGWSEPWGSVPGELTPEERARVSSRFSEVKFRNFTTGFTPLNTWFMAKTPEELAEAVRHKLLADTTRAPRN
jgi:hypothetical protein